jgi:hypothetical protein
MPDTETADNRDIDPRSQARTRRFVGRHETRGPVVIATGPEPARGTNDPAAR